MPKFNLSDEDVKALVIFLKSRRGMNFAETSLERYRATHMNEQVSAAANVKPAVLKTPPVVLSEGEKLVRDRACTACHKLGANDGGIAPDLSFEGLLKPEDWLFEHFRSPRSRVPDSIMPAFRFPETDFHAMAGYLAGLKSPPALGSPAESFKTLCARCHGDQGDGKGMTWLYLDPAPRDLTKAGFMTTKPRARLVKSIREGVPGTSMPGWHNILDEQRAGEVLDYVLATFTRQTLRESKPHKVPEKNLVAADTQSANRGEQIFIKRCAGCHGRKADGKGPNSLDIVPRPRNLRNAAFVAGISDQRLFDSILYGVQGTAMPPWIDYGLTQNEVGDIVNFIRSINQKSSGSQYASR